jgi:hypothetical protein
LTLSVDAWLHVLSCLNAHGPNRMFSLMMTCKDLWILGMPMLINSFTPRTFLKLEAFLSFLLADPSVRIPMLRRLHWIGDESHGYTTISSERESNLRTMGHLADVLEQAQNLEVLGLGMIMLEEEPRIVDALISGCPNVHNAYLYLFWRSDEIKRHGLLARLFTQVRWPLRFVSIQGGRLKMIPLLAQFAATLEEVSLPECHMPARWADMTVFPCVTKLEINYWDSYYRTPLVKVFPAITQLEAFTLFSTNEYRDMKMDDMAEHLDSANARPCEGWQHLDHVEGTVLAIHALTVPSRASVRRLRLKADLDHSETAIRLCSILEALRPTVLELCLTCEDDVDVKSAWDTWAPHAMASVRCLVLRTVFSAWSVDRDKRIGVHEFTVFFLHL